MRRYDLITLEGTKDFLFEECALKRIVETQTRALFKSMGYSRLITPGVEFYDVFNLNSRYFPQEELCKLTDNKGRLVVLRPDSTFPIARVAATRLKEATLPLRLYYTQPVYHFAPSLKGKSTEINQTGIELIGSASKMADIEVISAALSVLSSVGEGIPEDQSKHFHVNYSLELGDVRIFRELMHRLNATPAQKEEIRRLIEAKNYPALNDMLDKLGEHKITSALRKLPTLFGGEEVFDRAEEIFQDDRIAEILENMRELYHTVCEINQNGNVIIDLGLVNKTDYYTGLVIKGYLEGYGEEVISGGRYDKLLSEFGYDTPAVGMAVNVDAVANVIGKKYTPKAAAPDVLLLAENGCEAAAVRKADALRKTGICIEHAFMTDLDAAVEYAKCRNIEKIIVISKNPENLEISEIQEQEVTVNHA
ncbi:MAG: ATP phosphoribosyltransferase regulatory subunit [Oscillospiraceae bacterium]|nr:ATP phosphoribosyltransferase regulatory subunit [Oscillospiraceae bacterium]